MQFRRSTNWLRRAAVSGSGPPQPAREQRLPLCWRTLLDQHQGVRCLLVDMTINSLRTAAGSGAATQRLLRWWRPMLGLALPLSPVVAWELAVRAGGPMVGWCRPSVIEVLN